LLCLLVLALLLPWRQWPCGRALQALLCRWVLQHQLLLGQPQPQHCLAFLGQQGLLMPCVFCGAAVVLLAGLKLQLLEGLRELAGSGPQCLCAAIASILQTYVERWCRFVRDRTDQWLLLLLLLLCWPPDETHAMGASRQQALNVV
jgi:hypothetical protein